MNAKPVWRRFFGLPEEKLGWSSVLLAAGVFAFYGLLMLLMRMGQRGGATFWENKPLALCALAMLGSGIAGGIVAGWSILRKGERSFLVVLALAWGAFVLTFALGEIGGH